MYFIATNLLFKGQKTVLNFILSPFRYAIFNEAHFFVFENPHSSIFEKIFILFVFP